MNAADFAKPTSEQTLDVNPRTEVITIPVSALKGLLLVVLGVILGAGGMAAFMFPTISKDRTEAKVATSQLAKQKTQIDTLNTQVNEQDSQLEMASDRIESYGQVMNNTYAAIGQARAHISAQFFSNGPALTLLGNASKDLKQSLIELGYSFDE
ncbi:MAG: hypothetical protein ABI743_07155 [bacterium]